MSEDTVTLFRPVGRKELALIESMNYRGFPPRLPEQPIFYPVTNEDYARQIARDWNARDEGSEGFVTRFSVRKDFLSQYERQIVGGRTHEEYWIPAEQLDDLNANIVGSIEVIQKFTGSAKVSE